MDKPASSRPEYKPWLDMRAKCSNPNHSHWDQFGALGVKVWPAWQESFWDFLGDMDPFPGMGFEVGLRDSSESFAPGNTLWIKKKGHGRPPILGRSARAMHPIEYTAWKNIKQACYNPNTDSYQQVGGKGIKVHGDWLESFPLFLAAVGSKPSSKHVLARVDETGDFEPGNVIWRGPDQAGVRHRRDTTRYLFQGQSYRLVELLELANPEARITLAILRTRLSRTGQVPTEEEIQMALTQPRGRNKLSTTKKGKTVSGGTPAVRISEEHRTTFDEQVRLYKEKLIKEAEEKQG